MQKSQAYFNNKAKIDKAFHQKTAHKIQLYNNKLVDNFVEDFNKGGVSSKPANSMVMAELSILNKPEVYKNYNRIVNSPYTSNSNLNNMLIKNKANKDLDNVVKGELERITKNLDYVEQVLNKYNIPTKEYQKLLNEQASKSVANRQQLLKEVAVQNGEILKSEGFNIPSNVFTYKDIETTAQSMLRQSQMTAGYEEKLQINQEYLDNGKDAIYTHKQWIHTGAGATTRHESNHMQKVRFDEPFIVVNDKTLDIDEMMYPCDPAGSFSNAWICYCEVDYLIDEDDPYSETLDYTSGSIDIANPDLFNATPVANETPSVTFLPNIKGLFDSKPSGEVSNRVNLESPKIFDEARFNELKTHEETADFFGYDYNPNGKTYENINAKTFEFHDTKNDVTLRFFKDDVNKFEMVDYTNSGKEYYNLKDILKIYEDMSPKLKQSVGDITFGFDKPNELGLAIDSKNIGEHSVHIYKDAIDDSVFDLKRNEARGIENYPMVENIEHVMAHEMGHCVEFDVSLKETNSQTLNSIEMEKQWQEATKKDYKHQSKFNLDKEIDVSEYGSKDTMEDRAEMFSVVENLEKGVDNQIVSQLDYIEVIDPNVKRGKYSRDMLYSEVKKYNPNRYSLVKKWLNL